VSELQGEISFNDDQSECIVLETMLAGGPIRLFTPYPSR
jgi:hypothetical protein